MESNLGNIIISAASGGTLPVIWHMIPEGVKSRCGQGFDRLTGRLTRKWDQEDKKENADVDDDIKREGNKSEAQRKVLDLLVPDVAKTISADPVLLERATIEMMGDAYRKQENKDAVAEEALKDIGEKHTDNSSTNEALDEDWLNFFSSYAEKATSERTRQLWGRILSGEVRHPGRFSLPTLRLLSEIDQKTAASFVEISSFAIGNAIYFPKEYKSEHFSDLLRLENAGLINGISSPLAVVFKEKSASTAKIVDEYFIVLIKTNENKMENLRIGAIFLTDTGADLIKIIDKPQNNPDKMAKLEDVLKENISISRYSIHKITHKNGNNLNYEMNPISSWDRK
ncbi:hypothetical protein Amal_03172 [Acetobacter malorum]|uniref:DUF2806 domain-containing protein n=1 Tax=Acetobacter malorum TaxID=178901 RepID=A0A177G751_9PROT|nr:DUF2806 domain-containing protein [Acetobacter malorum]OAG75646.1 hypothetical protein Amal_03172 [Acetobacter malorum]